MRCSTNSRRSPSAVKGPRWRTSVDRGSGCSTGSMERTRNQWPVPAAEGVELLAASGQEDTTGAGGLERGRRLVHVGHVDPPVAHDRPPRRAQQANVGDAGPAGGGGSVERHDGGERMGRIDDGVDPRRAEERNETLHAAEAADAHRTGPRRGRRGHAGEGADDVHPVVVEAAAPAGSPRWSPPARAPSRPRPPRYGVPRPTVLGVSRLTCETHDAENVSGGAAWVRPSGRGWSSGHVRGQTGDDADEVPGGELGLTHLHVRSTSQ